MEILQNNDDTISIKTLDINQSLLEERLNDMRNLNNLTKKVYRLHTSLLYYRSEKHSAKGTVCYNTWQSFLKNVGGFENGFYDLGVELGMSVENLNYISTYAFQMKADPVDIVLKAFAQREDATLDKVIQSIIKMENYQILTSLEEPLIKLEKAFINAIDSGYCGNSDDMQVIMFNKINFNDLPPGLLIKDNISKKFAPVKKNRNGKKNPEPPNESNLIPFAETKKDGNLVLFLTFTEDGAQTAKNIKQYVKEWVEVPGVTIITLNDYRDEVFKNPGSFIQNHLEMADLVVPIMTEKYKNEISQHRSHTLNASGNLDQIYANLIYQKIENNYFVNGCYNFKVRSVIPKHSDVAAIARSFAMYPVLTPWTHEDNFNKQFKAFLKLD